MKNIQFSLEKQENLKKTHIWFMKIQKLASVPSYLTHRYNNTELNTFWNTTIYTISTFESIKQVVLGLNTRFFRSSKISQEKTNKRFFLCFQEHNFFYDSSFFQRYISQVQNLGICSRLYLWENFLETCQPSPQTGFFTLNNMVCVTELFSLSKKLRALERNKF